MLCKYLLYYTVLEIMTRKMSVGAQYSHKLGFLFVCLVLFLFGLVLEYFQPGVCWIHRCGTHGCRGQLYFFCRLSDPPTFSKLCLEMHVLLPCPMQPQWAWQLSQLGAWYLPTSGIPLICQFSPDLLIHYTLCSKCSQTVFFPLCKRCITAKVMFPPHRIGQYHWCFPNIPY